MTTSPPTPDIKNRAINELILFSVFLFLGLIVMPVVIYQVGQVVFGSYGGLGYGSFFGTLTAKVLRGDLVAWFLILSPYLGWQCLRLMIFAWRSAAPAIAKN